MTKILIVDDSKLMRDVLEDILEYSGYEVVFKAKNGLEAIHATKKFNPDIITMDISMPKCGGIDAVKEIKSINNSVKIIMCTAMGQSYHMKEAMTNGATDYIVKPFKMEKILHTINKVAMN